MKKILYATDMSEQSVPALTLAVNLSAELGASLDILHVFDVPTILGSPEGADFGEIDNKVEALDEAAVRAFCAARLDVQQLRVVNQFLVREGSTVAKEILSVVKEIQPYMLVVGTRGHSKAKDILLGSTARHLVEHSTCPVLSVPPAL
jgi:nucleotide-binding universal stress UspA family protein